MKTLIRPRPKLTSPGLTLAEVVIGATLLLVITAVALKALQLASKYHRRVETQQALTEKTFEAIYQIEKALEESRIGLIYLDAPEDTMSFLLPRNEDGQLTTVSDSGDLLWSTAVCYSLKSGQVERKQSPVSDPKTDPPNPLRLGMHTNFFSTLPANRILVSGCTLFEFEFADRLGNVGTTTDGTATNYVPPAAVPGEPDPLDKPAVVDIRLKLEEKGERTYGVTVQSTIFPRN